MFRLDKVLRYKERLEKEARAKRAEAEGRLQDLRDTIDRLRGARTELPDGEGREIEALMDWSGYVEALRDRERRVRLRVADLGPQVERLVQSHLRIRREVEGLRTLKERSRIRQRKRREARAQITLDEAAARTNLPGGGNDFHAEVSPGIERSSAETGREGLQRTLEAEWSTKEEKEA